MAEDKLGEAVLFLSTKAKELIEGIDKAKVAADGLQSHFNSVGSAIQGALAIAGVTVSIGALIAETAAAEDAQRALESTVKATAMAAGFTAEQLMAQATGLQDATRFSDEAVMGMQATLMRFGNIQGEVFRRAQTAVLDFATATGKDAASAAQTLGMALNDPTQGMSMLRRAGIALDAGMKEQIQTLAENGELLQAQTMLLDAFAKATGGRATASVNTLGGALDQLKNKFSDTFLEVRGPIRDTFVEFVQFVTKNMATISATVNALFATVKSYIESAVEVLFRFGEAVIKVFSRDFAGAIESLKAGVTTGATALIKAAIDGANAFDTTKASIAAAEEQTKKLAATAPVAGAALLVVSEKAIAAAEAANQLALKSSEAVRKAIQGPLLDVEAGYDELVRLAEEASQRALMASQLAAASAQAGLTAQAESAKRLAEGYSKDAERFSQAAVQHQQRLMAANLQLKNSTAQTMGAMAAQMMQGKLAIEEFVRQAIIQIGMLIAKMMILRAFGFGPMGSFGMGFVGAFGGGMAEGGRTRAGTTYMVGEEGPELWTSDRSGKIIPNDQLSAGGGVNVHQSFNISGMDFGSMESARRWLQTAAAMMRAGAIEAAEFAQASTDRSSLQERRAF